MLSDGVCDDLIHVYGRCVGASIAQQAPHDLGGNAFSFALGLGDVNGLALRRVAGGVVEEEAAAGLSQVMISWLSRSRRSFQRWGRSIIWQAMHFWARASAMPVPLFFGDAVNRG